MAKPGVQSTPPLKASTQMAPTPLQALKSETKFFGVKHPNGRTDLRTDGPADGRKDGQTVV